MVTYDDMVSKSVCFWFRFLVGTIVQIAMWDLLVELVPAYMGMIEYIRPKYKLEESLGKDVDCDRRTEGNRNLEPYIRPELKTIYEE